MELHRNDNVRCHSVFGSSVLIMKFNHDHQTLLYRPNLGGKKIKVVE